ncbi:MAG: pyridoxal-phosphate dependent enzyme [Chloroflexi bacterium]|nr:pyridoxal-phosphate dependent enzyme [Chloroflexota bacterium]
MQIVCSTCNAQYPLDTRAWHCPKCGGLFEIAGTVPFDPASIEAGNSSLWRYRFLLPLPDGAEPISMGEGLTPVVETFLDGLHFFSKLDFMTPTGSFKDRGTTVLISLVRSLGISRVVEDSSGNAAASLSAYAARAGIAADIFVPAHASPAKLAQIEIYGARVRKIEGPREKAALAVQKAAQGDAYYASHYYNPFVLAGMKTTAWELWEQFGRRAPFAVVAPVGHGTNLIGLARGFQALQEVGLIDRLPRLYAAQAAVVAPLVRAFENGLEDAPVAAPAQTVAEGIAINKPVRGREVLRALRETQGGAIAVSEEEIVQARNEMARVGLYIEPTSATAVAALRRLPEAVRKNSETVVTLTGSGLKSNV